MAKFERDEQTRMLQRIQKLLNLANDAGASEGERDNAMRMAHAILAKHNLDLAQVGALGGQEAQNAASTEPRVEHTATYGGWPWARMVSAHIGELFFCKYLSSTSRSLHFVHHYFIGRTSNATTAALVAEFVVKSIYSEACRRMRQRGEGYPYLRSFCWGAERTIRERVEQLKRDERQVAAEPTAPSSTPGTALVLAQVYATEEQQNALFIANKYPKLGKARQAKGASDSDAYHAGRAYGSTVSLNVQVK